MKINKLLAAILVIAMFAMLLTGCASAPLAQQKAEEPSEAAPAEETLAEVVTDCSAFTDTITIVNGANPGSSIDTYTKQFALVAQKYTDQTILIENKPGGSNSVALNHVLAQAHDGYTTLISGSSFEAKTAFGEYPDFTGDDYTCTGILHSEQFMVAVRADSQFQSLEDIIKYAKENPGTVNIGSSGNMSQMHLFVLNMMDAAEIDVDYVPYDDVSEYMLALLGGNIDVVLAAVNACRTYEESGDIRILAQGLEERSPSFPNIPTVFETPGLELDKFGGVGAYTFRAFKLPSDCPENMKLAWADLIEKVGNDPEWIEFSDNMGVDRVSFCTGAEAEETAKSFIAIYKDIFDAYQAQTA